MRVADRSTARNFLKYLDNAKTNYATTNERIASGNRFTRISDDVSADTRALRIRSDMAKAEEHYDNVKSINNELTATENAMTSISEIINNVHSKSVIKALNDPTSEVGRAAIANEIKAMKDELLQFANSKYYNRYVLGGSSAVSAPFSVGDDGRLKYNGINVDDIQQKADGSYYYTDAAGDEQTIPMDNDIYVDIGLGIRMNESNVNSDTAFRISYSGLEILGCGKEDNMSNNLYNLLNDIENAIRDGDMDHLKELDTRLVEQTDIFTANLTDIGARTKFLDTMQSRLEDEIDAYQKQVSNIMGINDAEESINQTMNDYVLKAVLSMGANIIPVSLMDYLK